MGMPSGSGSVKIPSRACHGVVRRPAEVAEAEQASRATEARHSANKRVALFILKLDLMFK